MALQRSLLLLIGGAVLCWSAWLLVLFNIDPYTSGAVGLTSFCATLFLAFLGTFSLLGFLFRRAFARQTVAYHHIGVSVRQGIFLALVVVGAVVLRGTGLYTWWSLAFLLAGFTVLEFFFLSREA